VPEGWKLVPVEPTDEMQAAADKLAKDGWDWPKAVYRSMIRVAPTLPVAPVQDEFQLRGVLARLKCWHRLTEDEANDLLRFAAARPATAAQQEPVAWMYPDDYKRMLTSETFCTVYSVEVGSATRGESTVALYTTPPAAQQEHDAYGYAKRLAIAIWEQHYKDVAPQWKPFDDLLGVLTQIDNMTAGLTIQTQRQPLTDEEIDAQRYRLLRRGQHWSVINGIGDVLRAETLDSAIDAAAHGIGEKK
jgi:hypothetical protein